MLARCLGKWWGHRNRFHSLARHIGSHSRTRSRHKQGLLNTKDHRCRCSPSRGCILEEHRSVGLPSPEDRRIRILQRGLQELRRGSYSS